MVGCTLWVEVAHRSPLSVVEAALVEVAFVAVEAALVEAAFVAVVAGRGLNFQETAVIMSEWGATELGATELTTVVLLLLAE